jgi:hypothetical protein
VTILGWTLYTFRRKEMQVVVLVGVLQGLT